MTTYTVQTWRYNGSEGDDDGPSELVSATPTTSERGVIHLLAMDGAVSPAAWDAPILSVIHQVNNVNGGELVVLVDGKRYGIEED